MKENIKKWVDALRSGNYLQGSGRLCYRLEGETTERYCCLGVACEVYRQEVEQGEELLPKLLYTNFSSYNGKIYYLPKTVRDWLGIVSEFSYMYLNDKLGYTFEEIADYAEQEYLKS